MTVVLPTIADARQWVRTERDAGRTLGLVPTLGALHEGHASLFRRARAECGRVAISIFVNPTQFGAGEDYERYPRTFESDRAIAEREGVDAIFAPDVPEMYPSPGEIMVEPGRLGEVLCGASRPGHFRGVLTVVAKLFHILPADRAYFGQKDAQQLVVIQRMVAEHNFPVEIVACPTVREPDGLALSSRNRYLSAEERSNATILYRALRCAESMLHRGVREGARLEHEMQQGIRATPGAELDYARVVDRWSLQPAGIIDREVLAAVAVRFGKTRLIDNLLIAPQR
ncbi:MAG: pantoate--beta-alanine ligase [Acidobacteria bacterium]|nr:pantoate--beta-alanine ligase [Acidobacteriota bacterium]